MRPDNDVATKDNGSISNASLYFSSWFSWICVVLLIASFLSSDRESNILQQYNRKAIPAETAHWLSWFLTSVVMMGSAINLHHGDKCRSSFRAESTFCHNVMFLISFGVSGIAISTTFIALTMTRVLRYHLVGHCKTTKAVFPYPSFHSWSAVCILSCTSCIEQVLSKAIRILNADYILLATTISFILSVSSILAHFLSSETFVGQKAELIITSLLLLLWAPIFHLIILGTDSNIPMGVWAILYSIFTILLTLTFSPRSSEVQILPLQNPPSQEQVNS